MKHEVTLTFLLDEEVTPRIFAERVGMACAARGALRLGEGVRTEDGHELFVRETTEGEKAQIDDLLASLTPKTREMR